MRLPVFIERAWRHRTGTYSIDDPRPIAAEAPYTYFVPSENELLAVAVEDLIKIILRSHPPSPKWDAERIWLTVTATDRDNLEGSLGNEPFDIPQLKCGDAIQLRRTDIIDIIWSEDRTIPPPPSPARREYRDRCMVDDCVLQERSPVDYLYREEPDIAGPEEKYPDSGWRIRGTDEGIAEDERQGHTPQYVALGAVLNADDDWLSLIDAPIGSRFIRDLETGLFIELEASECGEDE